MRRTALWWILGIACGWGVAMTADAAGPRPNIIVLLADDFGYADTGFQGCRDIPTPHLDALAAGGIRCTNGYVSGPYCSPTRAGFMTGRYQQRFGHEFNPGGSPELGLPLTESTIADRLRAVGYATGVIGKWHLGEAAKFHPQRRGFDEFFGFLGGAHPYFPGQGAPIYRGTTVVKETEYLTDAFAREAVGFIDRHKGGDRPFFLYLAFNAVHTPMHATDERLQRFASIRDTTRRTYAAMTVALDEAVGKVLARLRDEGLEENTLIAFFSDNGGPTMPGTTINGSRNDPLRGSKRTTLEGGIRVPFVLHWKGKLPAGSEYHQPVIQLDLLPTALAAAGAEIDPAWQLDGVNLLPYLTGQVATPPHDTLYWRMGDQMAIRQGDWKLVRYDPNADVPVEGNLDRAQARARARAAAKEQGGRATPRKLYHLGRDIGEARDLVAEHPEQVTELEAVWQKWNAQLARPLWGAGSEAAARKAD
jgi:arylsulfatase A-like enzyme